MSALSRIRQNIGLIAVVIGIALLAFILTDFLSGITGFFQGPIDAGTVAGQTITDQEYRERVSNALQQVGSQDELENGRARDQVWNQMVSEKVFDLEYEKIGLEISNDELLDMFAGDEISPFLRQYLLAPGQQYDRAQMQQFLEQINEDPERAQQFKPLEDYAIKARAQQKYLAMISAGFLGSQASARQQYINQNKKVDLSFLAVNYTQIPDSQVQVSDGEMQTYINAHKDEAQFKQEDETLLRYVKFELKPSKPDSSKSFNKMAKLKETFANSTKDSSYTSNKSRTPYGQNYQPISNLPVAIRDQVVNAEPKTVIGPIQEQGYYKLYKLVGTEAAETSSAKINHILLTFKADTQEVRNKAADLARQARSGSDFGELAQENSEDFRSRINGGSLGWYQRNLYGEDFDDAIEKASVGSIIGPIKGRGGFHVVQVVAKTNKNYDIAQIEDEIIYSTTTRDSVYREANQFAAQLNQTKDINQASTDASQVAYESNPITEATRDVLGLNGGRDLVIWALNNDVGDISKVFRIKDNYVIAQVTDRKKEGVKSVDDVRDIVERKVRNQKKAELIKKSLMSIGGQDLNAMKDAYGAGAFVSTAQGITFESASIPGIGSEKAIIGKALGMAQGATSAPMVGDNGVYVIQVTGITEASEPDEATLIALKNSQSQQGALSIQNKIQPALIDIADVEDTRAKSEARNSGY